MDLFAILQQIGLQFKPEVLTLLGVAFCFVVLVLAGALVNAIRKSEALKQYEGLIQALGQKIADLIIFAEWGDEYSQKADFYEKKQAERTAAGLYYVDPRMLYVMDKVEQYALDRHGLKIEFDDVLPLAEKKYRELLNSGTFDSGGTSLPPA